AHPTCRLTCLHVRRTPTSTLFPYTTLFRSTSRIAIAARRRRGSSTACSTGSCGGCGTTASSHRRDLEHMSSEAVQTEQRRANLRSEEHTSELQSRENLVCRLLLEKKKKERE